MLLGWFLVVGFFREGGLGGRGWRCSLSGNRNFGCRCIGIFPIKFQVRCCWLEGYCRTLDLHIGCIFTSLATAVFILDKLIGKMSRLLIFQQSAHFSMSFATARQSLLNHNQGAVWFPFSGNPPASGSGCYGVTCCLSIWRYLTSWPLLPVAFDSHVDALSTVTQSLVSQLLGTAPFQLMDPFHFTC